jgi:hypothetical protein
MSDHGDFLVALDNVLFYCEKLENGSISGTRVPSAVNVSKVTRRLMPCARAYDVQVTTVVV